MTKATKNTIENDAIEATAEEQAEEQAEPLTMSKTMAKHRAKYVATASASGRKSLHNGDELAKVLEYKDHNAVVAAAEQLLELETGTLATKYAKLNNGQKRMNAGNRIRGALKRGEITIEEIKGAFAA